MKLIAVVVPFGFSRCPEIRQKVEPLFPVGFRPPFAAALRRLRADEEKEGLRGTVFGSSIIAGRRQAPSSLSGSVGRNGCAGKLPQEAVRKVSWGIR